MSDLVELQRALDLYGAAVYWHFSRRYGGLVGEQTEDAASVRDVLRSKAVGAGASEEQLDDARRYAHCCAIDHRKPLMAGASFRTFEKEVLR
ncbi:hypothetical protein [Mycolicibacter kumamotonensis]|uniref:Uncharacterized protein n=1 Tax=Mycolicibacter kumamotonensis TaxID=354243 RepID=A0A1B8SL60_9MYCO|nr:hypothetical protein [Mycolicibacter kumamotonensis]OBY33447.1 hypothetical protein ACT18_00405 [Mycolicibacter kumamotonensis]